jgi:hypothetical protein
MTEVSNNFASREPHTGKLGNGGFLEILAAVHIDASDWVGPVFSDGAIYESVASMIAARRTHSPSYVYAAKASEPTPDAEEILNFLFPDGLPTFESIPRETAAAVHAIIAAAHKLARAPGMQRLIQDRQTIIVVDAQKFEADLISEISEEITQV